jgi:hypothetical protein
MAVLSIAPVLLEARGRPSLKDVLRRMAGKGREVALSSARVREVQAVFDQRMQAARSWR